MSRSEKTMMAFLAILVLILGAVLFDHGVNSGSTDAGFATAMGGVMLLFFGFVALAWSVLMPRRG